MSTLSALPVSSNSATYSSGAAKTENLRKALAIGDRVPISAINPDLLPCMPLYEAAGSRDYTYPIRCGFESYKVYVGPMGGADPTKYMLQIQYYNTQQSIDTCMIAGSVHMTLDLGTKNINVARLVAPVNANYMPGDSLYGSCLQTMLSDIKYTWHSKNSSSDTAAVPGMQEPYEFMQCFINQVSTGVNQNLKKANGTEKAKIISKPTRILIGANSKIDPSAKMFDITGRAVPNTSKLNPGVYIQKK